MKSDGLWGSVVWHKSVIEQCQKNDLVGTKAQHIKNLSCYENSVTKALSGFGFKLTPQFVWDWQF